MPRGGEIEFEKSAPLKRQKPRPPQGPRRGPAPPQEYALVHRAYRQPLRAMLLENARNFHCSMAVGVSLHNAADGDARSHRIERRTKVGRDSGARDGYVGTERG